MIATMFQKLWRFVPARLLEKIPHKKKELTHIKLDLQKRRK
jgi:hypothetical protein